VKDWVDIPLWGKFEPNRYWGYDLSDFEWPVSSRCEFCRAMRQG
jgi:hypothetical protein